MSHPTRTFAALLLALELSGLAFGPVMAESPMPTRPDAETATGFDVIVEKVTERLRERDGKSPEPAEVVGALNSITVQLYRDGQYPKAKQVAALALDHAERVLGAEHPGTLISINNLALLYQVQGRYGEAEPL
jgi:hypothetical protein